MTISIRSIDIGFDLRAVGQRIILPADTDCVLCDLPERDGIVQRWEEPVTGSREKITRALRGLGYRIDFDLR